MGRTWKFTEQIYEELKENVDKKLETYFHTGLLGNPFEKYAWEIDYGIAKMNDYVEQVNEADGFNRAKLDRVYEQIADTDKSYGNRIKKCTEDMKYYKNVLHQLEVVMEQALVGSSNGNAVFDFDREAFQTLVKDDKNAMDIAYVDRILSQDVAEITYDEYVQIAILLGNQTGNDTTLIQYILNSEYLWNFINVSELNGNGVAPEAEGMLSSGVMLPNEKYVLLSAALKEYAYQLVIHKVENHVTTEYLDILNNVLMYSNLFAMADDFLMDNTWNYLIGEEPEMKQSILKEFFTIEYGETSIGGVDTKHSGILVTINGYFGDAELEILKPFNGDSAITGLNDLEHTYINHYLELDMSDEEYLNHALLNQLWDAGKDAAMSVAYEQVTELLKIGGAGAVAVETGIGIIIGTAEDMKEHQEQKEAILQFEEEGSLASTVHLLELYCSIGNYNHTFDGSKNAVVTVYPTSITEERIEMVNRLIEDGNKGYLNKVDIESLPDGKLTLDFIIEHIDEVDKILDQIQDNVRNKSSYNSLLEILEAEYAE